ncbi:hypothetical protein [Nautilia sp.]
MKKIIITDEIKNNHYKNLKGKLKKLEEDLKKLNSPYSLRDILISKPDKLYEIGEWSKNQSINFDYMKSKYNDFIKKKEKEDDYDAYELAKYLNVNTCPYCNITSIYTVINENNEKIVRPEFDHFFDKATYPILSLSIYNLIPSCHQCNSNLKHTKSFNLDEYIHPYIDDIDKKIKFKLKFCNVKFYHSIDGFEIEIQNINNSIKVENHLKVFKIKERYSCLKDIILELIQKKYIYNESYLDELFKKYEGTFFKNIEDLKRLISGGYISESEINKRPLSKFIKDISEELEI